MKFEIPRPLKVEHEELHEMLLKATKEPGELGDAAKAVARLMHPHFVKEEEYALPPLGLLHDLAQGNVTPDMKEVLKLTDKLKAELGQMLAEHKSIVAVLDELSAAAKKAGRMEYLEFAKALMLHAQTEEEVFYPTAMLIGEYVRQKLRLPQRSNESFVRWQGRTIEQLGFVNNLVIGLATAILIFVAKLPFEEKVVLSCNEKLLAFLSVITIFFSIAFGCYVAWNRLRSFRETAQIARKRETGNTQHILELRVLVMALDCRTWPLLAIQTILFGFGALLFAIFSSLRYLA